MSGFDTLPTGGAENGGSDPYNDWLKRLTDPAVVDGSLEAPRDWHQAFAEREVDTSVLFNEAAGNAQRQEKRSWTDENGEQAWLNTYRPIYVQRDPDGNPGYWKLRLREKVEKPAPEFLWRNDDTFSLILPPVRISYCVEVASRSGSQGGEAAERELFERPTLFLLRDDTGAPIYVLADDLALMEEDVEALARTQARYVKWLELAKDASEPFDPEEVA